MDAHFFHFAAAWWCLRWGYLGAQARSPQWLWWNRLRALNACHPPDRPGPTCTWRCTHSGGLWCRGASAPPPALGYLYVVRCRRIGIENGFQASSSGDVALAMGSLLTAVELPRALNACPFSQPPCSKISRPLRRIVVFPVPTAVELACATLFLYDDRERAGVRAQGACSSSSFYSKQRASAGLDAAAGEPTGSSRAALPSRSLQHRRQGGGLCARLRRHSMSLAASASRPAARW